MKSYKQVLVDQNALPIHKYHPRISTYTYGLAVIPSQPNIASIHDVLGYATGIIAVVTSSMRSRQKMQGWRSTTHEADVEDSMSMRNSNTGFGLDLSGAIASASALYTPQSRPSAMVSDIFKL
jgi:hypothetical protein